MAIRLHYILTLLYPPSPAKRVFVEHYIKFKGRKLYFDFYVPGLNMLFECQGQQHFKFNAFFQGTKEAFISQKKRDNLKIDYIQQEGMYLVYVNYNEEITTALVLDRINEAMNSECRYAGLTS